MIDVANPTIEAVAASGGLHAPLSDFDQNIRQLEMFVQRGLDFERLAVEMIETLTMERNRPFVSAELRQLAIRWSARRNELQHNSPSSTAADSGITADGDGHLDRAGLEVEAAGVPREVVTAARNLGSRA